MLQFQTAKTEMGNNRHWYRDKYIITCLLYQPLDVIAFSYLHYCTVKFSRFLCFFFFSSLFCHHHLTPFLSLYPLCHPLPTPNLQITHSCRLFLWLQLLMLILLAPSPKNTVNVHKCPSVSSIYSYKYYRSNIYVYVFTISHNQIYLYGCINVCALPFVCRFLHFFPTNGAHTHTVAQTTNI